MASKFVSQANAQRMVTKLLGLISGKAASSHTHTKSQVTDFPASLKNPSALSIQLNGGAATSYDGSAAKSVNVTASGIGAAAASHTHPYLPLSGGNMTGAVRSKTNAGTVGTVPSSNQYGNALALYDAAGAVMGHVESVVRTDGKTGTYIDAQRTVGGAAKYNSIQVLVGDDGTQAYAVSNPANFRSAINAVSWQQVYPVGAVYISYVSTSPASLFGGTWTQITGRFLRMAADVSTGGSASHSHWQTVGKGVGDKAVYVTDNLGPGSTNPSGKYPGDIRVLTGMSGCQLAESNVGGSWFVSSNVNQTKTYADSTLPPYQDLYAWRRTA